MKRLLALLMAAQVALFGIEGLSIEEVHSSGMIVHFKAQGGFSDKETALMIQELDNNEPWKEAMAMIEAISKGKFSNPAEIRDYAPKAVALFASAQKQTSNPLPSYVGMMTLSLYFGLRGSLTKEYLGGFLDILTEYNICFAYIVEAQSYAKGRPGFGKSHKKAYATLREASDICVAPGVATNVKDMYRHAVARERFLVGRGY